MGKQLLGVKGLNTRKSKNALFLSFPPKNPVLSHPDEPLSVHWPLSMLKLHQREVVVEAQWSHF